MRAEFCRVLDIIAHGDPDVCYSLHRTAPECVLWRFNVIKILEYRMNGKSLECECRSTQSRTRSQTGTGRDVPSRRDVRGLRPPAVPAYERLCIGRERSRLRAHDDVVRRHERYPIAGE